MLNEETARELADKFFSKTCDMITFDNREDWLELRRYGIGGSDVASIVGHSPFRGRKEIYKSKVEKVPQITNEAIEFGNTFEPLIFETFKAKYSHDYVVLDYKDTMFRNKMLPMLQASLDGVLVDKFTNQVGILEIKTSQGKKRKWYDSYNQPCVPNYYLDQAVHYFNTTNADFVLFYVLVNNKSDFTDYDMYFLKPRIIRRTDIVNYCNAILKECMSFWNTYVIPRKEPTDLITY